MKLLFPALVSSQFQCPFQVASLHPPFRPRVCSRVDMGTGVSDQRIEVGNVYENMVTPCNIQVQNVVELNWFYLFGVFLQVL